MTQAIDFPRLGNVVQGAGNVAEGSLVGQFLQSADGRGLRSFLAHPWVQMGFGAIGSLMVLKSITGNGTAGTGIAGAIIAGLSFLGVGQDAINGNFGEGSNFHRMFGGLADGNEVVTQGDTGPNSAVQETAARQEHDAPEAPSADTPEATATVDQPTPAVAGPPAAQPSLQPSR